MQLSLCKGNANREKNEMNSFISYSEMQLSLCKGNANREKNEMNLFISYSEMQLSLYKAIKKNRFFTNHQFAKNQFETLIIPIDFKSLKL